MSELFTAQHTANEAADSAQRALDAARAAVEAAQRAAQAQDAMGALDAPHSSPQAPAPSEESGEALPLNPFDAYAVPPDLLTPAGVPVEGGAFAAASGTIEGGATEEAVAQDSATVYSADGGVRKAGLAEDFLKATATQEAATEEPSLSTIAQKAAPDFASPFAPFFSAPPAPSAMPAVETAQTAVETAAAAMETAASAMEVAAAAVEAAETVQPADPAMPTPMPTPMPTAEESFFAAPVAEEPVTPHGEAQTENAPFSAFSMPVMPESTPAQVMPSEQRQPAPAAEFAPVPPLDFSQAPVTEQRDAQAEEDARAEAATGPAPVPVPELAAPDYSVVPTEQSKKEGERAAAEEPSLAENAAFVEASVPAETPAPAEQPVMENPFAAETTSVVENFSAPEATPSEEPVVGIVGEPTSTEEPFPVENTAFVEASAPTEAPTPTQPDAIPQPCDINALLDAAVATKPHAAALLASTKNALLCAMADSLIAHTGRILAANAADLAAAKGVISDVMLDRLALDEKRICGMADGLRAVALLPDPVGTVDETHTCENGLLIEKTRVPMGVIAIIYESRPNVTADAAALCLKSGNVCVLRGGRDAIRSNAAIVEALHAALRAYDGGQPESLINLVTDTRRESAKALMTARGRVDLLIPRGGAGLIRACVDGATVPCIETGTGICHIYVDKAADFTKARAIVENAKTSRPSVCNAAEVCLVHAEVAQAFLPTLAHALGRHHVQLRCDPYAYAILSRDAAAALADAETADGVVASNSSGNGLDSDAATHSYGASAPADGAPLEISGCTILPAGEHDFDTEFLDYVMAVGVVNSLPDAVAHIARHSTGHSEAIVTEDSAAADTFCRMVDSAAVYVNASTRFTDGGEFGLGCEIGISTQKLGARGPMGLREMTTYKYIIHGNGQIR